MTTTLAFDDNAIEITTVWGLFVGLVIGLYILFLFYKYHQWKRANRATSEPVR